MEEQEDMEEYINSLDWNSGQEVNNLREGFEQFRLEKNEKQLAAIAHKNGLELTDLKNFVNTILSRMIFDGEKLTDLLEPLDLGWKVRKQKELELMKDLLPELQKLAQGREIAGLKAYE